MCAGFSLFWFRENPGIIQINYLLYKRRRKYNSFYIYVQRLQKMGKRKPFDL